MHFEDLVRRYGNPIIVLNLIKVFPERQGKWKATTQSREFLKSIQRYYSNTYTDGEKQDAINLFLGYIQPQDGKPALWELDSDYYLHVVGIGDDIFPGSGVLSIPKPMSGIGVNLAPVPAFREDFSRKKPASFDKLIEQTCSSIKNVRLCSETDQRPGGSTGSTGVAPDAAEIQLKSPNWLFGSRKPEESGSATRPGADDSEKGVTSSERESTISATWNHHEEGIFQRDTYR
ncbi:PREDICTED: phosphoinositide phosphatase SAC1 isoform X2 [Brassica oleracea var. oleracea]|uniref:phosphoinositide phosphatase SAC1 isoform X1 n=1 Tax=Brassica oleracea var. oleracea TaxID=109376 RepID=UPI0006A6DE75|nr:PREDICTED: phosphoinositide phosphatase SAC1 isoform X1 [Brassica oleracea var. oleracea]XP_013585569.1 PREDICTED: phosphoinositide phosphatase SAC1 isoform X2 [Brassica oleracea var. oleracea]XP_013585570.1 PREDICTED: phosphoinositide phosphatase SAC1 isoform X2 [Brassica oleracea var. oleracea]XP_013585571.1 PREDICTED: phosphoinositide phosphatase SAC1 isoform X2 [Brassica oleracea var. oleracea]XP_013585572.1 PREDICTED: phosphoinositide phosphatase SAC1 isoform X2 [Brassica oleracea var. 